MNKHQDKINEGSEKGFPIPPRQLPYLRALEVGFEALLSQDLSNERLNSLGAEGCGEIISLPSLGQNLSIDLEKREVRLAANGPVHYNLALLAIHYLCAQKLAVDTSVVSLNYFADCRGYLDAFNRRIIGRFLGTVGRTEQQFIAQCEQHGAERLPGTSPSFRFMLFPRLPIVIIRNEGDEEMPAGANILYQADIEYLLPPEDRVVAAEFILNILSGKPM